MAAPRAAPPFAELDSESGSEESNGSKVQDFWKQKLLVPAVFTLYVLTKSLDKIFIYRVRKSMAHYSTVLMTIYWPPGVCLACFVFLLMLNTVKRALGQTLAEGPEGKADSSIGPLSWFSPFSEYASSQGRVPQRWFALIAFCDQINATFSSPPAVFIPAVMLTPLYNSVVLWTALISFFLFGNSLPIRAPGRHLPHLMFLLCGCDGRAARACSCHLRWPWYGKQHLARWHTAHPHWSQVESEQCHGQVCQRPAPLQRCKRKIRVHSSGDSGWHVSFLGCYSDPLRLCERLQAEKAEASESGRGLGLFLAICVAGALWTNLHPRLLDSMAHTQWD